MSGIVCQQTLRRHHRCRPSANDKKLIYSNSHLLISPFNNMHSLGGPCGDIHLGHFKKTVIEFNLIATSPAGLESHFAGLGWTQATVPPGVGLHLNLQFARLGHDIDL